MTASDADKVALAVSAFGAAATATLSNPAIKGEPEDQLRVPLVALVKALAPLCGLGGLDIELVGETRLSDLIVRPDFAVSGPAQAIDIHFADGSSVEALPKAPTSLVVSLSPFRPINGGLSNQSGEIARALVLGVAQRINEDLGGAVEQAGPQLKGVSDRYPAWVGIDWWRST